jgi:uncharacterized protein (DUF2267 family)
MKKSHEYFSGNKHLGIEIDLVTPVKDLVESSARNCSTAKKLKTEAIPTLIKSAQYIIDPSLKNEATQHLGEYSTLVEDVDTCSHLEKIEDRLAKLEADNHKHDAEKEIRAWIDVARNLISEDMKKKFPNAFPKIIGNIYWKDWVSLARTDTRIYDEIFKSVNSLFGLKQTEWEKISGELYKNLSKGFHARKYDRDLKKAKEQVDILVGAQDNANGLLKQLFKKVSEAEQQTPIVN